MNRLLRSIAKYFLPVLFISYIGCISLFTHTHVVNGVTIVHSHPYNPKAHHGHTTTEFQLIHALSHLTTAEPSVGGAAFGCAVCLFVPVVLSGYPLRTHTQAVGGSRVACSARFDSVK